VRWYRPRDNPPNAKHEAKVLCDYLAREVQAELDSYQSFNPDFPPPANRPQGVLVITDRSLDLMAPLLHEFTYQAMAHDLLPLKDNEKVTYRIAVSDGTGKEEDKDMEIGEKDKLWTENRHRHMKDTIGKIEGEFKKFIADNPHFTDATGDSTSLSAIKDMLAGLPQFQELKEAYSLHLSMAQECMDVFSNQNLFDLGLVEQSLATGLDEDFRKPKNLTDQVIRLLADPIHPDDKSIGPAERLRLILMYALFREGMIQEDYERLLVHAGLPSEKQDTVVISNLDFLGGRTSKEDLKQTKPTSQPIFARKPIPPPSQDDEGNALSRFEPNLKLMLEELSKGTLDQTLFPYTRPPMDNSEELAMQAQTSLRSAKPTWARNRTSTTENRQRVVVFMAGGATYSEARACYEISEARNKDIFLVTSHMLTPSLFVRQLRDLDAPRKRLDLPIDRPQAKAPDHLFMRNDPPPPRPQPNMTASSGSRPGGLPSRSQGGPLPPPPNGANYNRPSPQPPTAGLAAMSMNSSSGRAPIPLNGVNGSGKLEKKGKAEGEEKKKKRGFFGHKKDKS
jgi:syntaxin-binding protein 1